MEHNISLISRMVLLLVLLHSWRRATGDIIATSLINECIRGDDELRNFEGNTCTKKLVVAMTVHAEEVSSAQLSKSSYILLSHCSRVKHNTLKPMCPELQKLEQIEAKG